MSRGNLIARLRYLRTRVNEKKPLNGEDIWLIEEAQSYIKSLEDTVAILEDRLGHYKEDHAA